MVQRPGAWPLYMLANSSFRRGAEVATALRRRLLALDRIARRVQRQPRLWLAGCALLLAVQISPAVSGDADTAKQQDTSTQSLIAYYREKRK